MKTVKGLRAASVKPGRIPRRMDFRRVDSLATHASLLERLKDLEDQESWQQFYSTYRKLIFSFALKHGLTGAEAEEVVQETVITVARNLPRFRYDPKRCSFKTWLFNLTLWRVRDQLRKRRPQVWAAGQAPEGTDFSRRLEEIPGPEPEAPSALWEEEFRKDVLDRSLTKVKARVDERQFQIFDLYAMQGWPARKVARTLGLSLPQVYVTKHRLLLILSQEIRRLRTRENSLEI
ncbi:sigma-70 family RNA polymerase sigma factor [bacterium]|nr:sigma-70 family RNA polymerase sigma factor [bacterium]